ncbi:hypothetical protein FHK02_5600, partial [Spirosoma sp. LMG 31448]|nr:hypothetical protein [Spirosoma utsteinense]
HKAFQTVGFTDGDTFFHIANLHFANQSF